MNWTDTFPANGEVEIEASSDSTFGPEQLQFEVMLGDAITRPAVSSPYPASFRIRGDHNDRNRLFEFWRTAAGEFFTFPHPMLGMVDARFPAKSTPSGRNLKGDWYEIEFDLEIKPPATTLENLE